MPYSLVIITKNEERNIERCIRSAPSADDIVVVDSGSEDKTVDIARRLGARVTVEPWRGFAKQKIRATALAKNDWVLSLDADEALSPEALAKVNEIIGQNGSDVETAYSFPRKTFHLGKWILHAGMYPDYQTRLFHRSSAHWQDVPVHERLDAKKIEKLKVPILHWSFNDLAHQITTVNTYSGLRANEFFEKGQSFSLMKLAVKPFGKFIETFFVKRGYMDGVPGFIVSCVAAFATFLRWAKLYEKHLSKKEHPR